MGQLPKISTILYASDLGEHTRPVFRQAVDQARVHNASIIMLHVVEPLTETARTVMAAYMPEADIDVIQQDGMAAIIKHMKNRITKFYEEECAGQGLDSLPVKEMLVVAGRPSEQILNTAAECKADMIIIGQSAKKILGSRVIGSTARRVTRLTTIPTLIIPNV